MLSLSVAFSDCSTACAKLQQHYDKLIRLPAKALLPSLYASGVVTFDQKQIIEAKHVNKEKMGYVLDLIINSLKADIAIKYNNFIQVMKDSKDFDANELVKILGKFKFTECCKLFIIIICDT